MKLTEESACPHCGENALYRESADVGVGILYGPWGCMICGWSEDERFDSSKGPSPAAVEHPDHLVFSDGSMVPKKGVQENLDRFNIKLPEDL